MVENSRQPAPGNRQLGCTVSLDLEPRLPRKAWSRKHFFFHFKRAPRKTICTDWGQFLGTGLDSLHTIPCLIFPLPLGLRSEEVGGAGTVPHRLAPLCTA